MKKFMYILSFLFLGSSLMADTISLSFFQNATDNLFQNRYSESDQVSSLNFYLDKDLSRISIFTEGNYSYLHQNPNLAYYVHDLGLDYLHPVDEKSAFYLSLTGRGAFYRSDYSDYNYLALNFFTMFKSYISQTSILNANYSLEYKNFKSSIFDSVSHSLLVSFDKYLQIKTTLKAEMSWGYKYFLHPYLTQEIAPFDGSQFFYRGRGKGSPSGGMRYQYTTQTKSEGQGIQIFSLAGLIAQGLGNKAGLNLTGVKQWFFSGENPFTFIEEFYTVENPSYDRFSWSGYQLGSQLSLLAPWNIQLKMGYTIGSKEFPGIESLNLEGESLGVTRKDRRNQAEVRVEKNFPRLTLFLNYSYVVNHSNDPFFEWTGHFFSAGIEWNFLIGEGK